MAALPAVPNVVKIELMGVASSSAWANLIHLQFSGGPPTTADMNLLCTHVATAYTANLTGQLNLQTVLQQIQTTDLTSSSGATGALLTNILGSDTTNPAPASAAMVIKKHIARRYRGGHPKTFLLPKSAGDLFDQDSWKATYATNARGAWVAFITALLATHGSITCIADVNVSYYQGFTNVTTSSGRMKAKPTLRAVPLVDVITGYVGEQKVGSQRRRTSGG